MLLLSAEYFAVIAGGHFVSFKCTRRFDRSRVFSVMKGMKFAVIAAPLKIELFVGISFQFSEWILLCG